jgi:hypothetical protein
MSMRREEPMWREGGVPRRQEYSGGEKCPLWSGGYPEEKVREDKVEKSGCIR